MRRVGASESSMVNSLRAVVGVVSVALALAGAMARGDEAPEAVEPASAAPTGDACMREAAAAVQRRYEGVRDLQARFVQTSLAAGRATPVTSRGAVVMAVPGRMRWSYEEPEPSLLVSDGKILWIYDPAFGEAQRLPVGDGGYLSGAAIQFLLGEGDLFRDFRVTALSCQPAAAELLLVPREPASYEKLQILVDPATGDVSRTEVVDLLGNSTRVEFRNLEVNRHPPASTFRFDPPEGVSVVDLTP
jgi:outer membrane lipoprotein carrier protein